MAAAARPQKITFREMRESGVAAVLIYCSDFRCSHSVEMLADRRPDDVRLSDIELRSAASVAARALTSGHIPAGGRGRPAIY